MNKIEASLRRRVGAIVRDAVAAGYVLQFDVGKPAAKRQALTENSLYLRPLDGSDLYACSCCGLPYEPLFRSRYLPNYVPINWCGPCRLELVEAGGRADKVLVKKAESRLAVPREIITASVKRWCAVVQSWGGSYAADLSKLCVIFDAKLLEQQVAEMATDNKEAVEFRAKLAERVG